MALSSKTSYVQQQRPKKLKPTKFLSSSVADGAGEGSTSSLQTSVTESTSSSSSIDMIRLKAPAIKNMDKLYQVPLQELDCSFDTVSLKSKSSSLRKVVQSQAKTNGADVTVVFAIRYPSCPSCREHGLQLTELAAKDRKMVLLGAVKDGATTANDSTTKEAVLEFYQNYFNGNPIYQDSSMGIYSQALGDKKYHPVAGMLRVFKALKRYKRGQICVGPVCAMESKVLGGALIFDKHGNLRFVYEEKVGLPFDMQAIAEAVKETRSQGNTEMMASD
eukprot:CAMPEP_0198138360 /NCGR_PEP_ID=MMETSP1443-20131203/1773_1 /TAXON_ID=186043 /ORGANISM="Entomoneis sp., Strain CCMP2396" /LENGTH=275 /DNA_ID=CAMNT_0043800105 /DNA_START=63 /DNA_END=890 /DNA_ORIENTATION=-